MFLWLCSARGPPASLRFCSPIPRSPPEPPQLFPCVRMPPPAAQPSAAQLDFPAQRSPSPRPPGRSRRWGALPVIPDLGSVSDRGGSSDSEPASRACDRGPPRQTFPAPPISIAAPVAHARVSQNPSPSSSPPLRTTLVGRRFDFVAVFPPP
jgi:hypothetical protein